MNNNSKFKNLKIGDIVIRNMCGLKMKLEVTNIDNQFIYCGDWKFDINTGAEIDEELGWGNNRTGSYIYEQKN